MLPLLVCVMLIVQCFAQDFSDSPRFNLQKDKIVELSGGKNKDWTIPDTKFVYNYQQMRPHQEHQIGQREGDLRQYIHKNPISTMPELPTEQHPIAIELQEKDKITGDFDTSVPVPEKPRYYHHRHHPKGLNVSSSGVPNLLKKQKVNSYRRHHYPSHVLDNLNYPSAYPVYLPMLPQQHALPRWEDLHKPLKQHAHHKHGMQKTKLHQVVNHSSQREPTPTAMPIAIVYHPNVNPSKQHNPSRHHVPIVSNQNGYVKPVLAKKQPAISRAHNTINKHHSIHGRKHKLNQDEISQTPYSSTVKNVPANKTNSPPPAPTLSPWYDGYGK